MKMAKVFFVARPIDRGWYYQINLNQPVGPFLTKNEAVLAAQAEKLRA